MKTPNHSHYRIGQNKYYTNLSLNKDKSRRTQKPPLPSKAKHSGIKKNLSINTQGTALNSKTTTMENTEGNQLKQVYIRKNEDINNNAIVKNKISVSNMNTNSNISDIDLVEYTFSSLGIDSSYLDVLYSNQINFDDLLLLTKDDLKEMNIPIGPRNRLLLFISKYSAFSNAMSLSFHDQYEMLRAFFARTKASTTFSSSNVLVTNHSLHYKNSLSQYDNSSHMKNYLSARKSSEETYKELIQQKEDLKEKLKKCNKNIIDKKEVSIINITNRC